MSGYGNSHHHSNNLKPENALRRATELVNLRQTEAALSMLHETLGGRRHKTWSPVYEKVVLLYLDLCLRGHRSREAKDGLHQYRNLSQSQAPGSLEVVVQHLLTQAEAKCRRWWAEHCRQHALLSGAGGGAVAGGSVSVSAPADQQQLALLLRTVSLDPDRARADAAPALKFLWEAYRAVLDILKSNSKLEHLYHSTALAALKFCQTYSRRTEFRRTCDMLRQHLSNLQKYGGIDVNKDGTKDGDDKKAHNKVRGWEGWTTDSVELHLTTRFAQLAASSELHLYTEGYRTVEDIHQILHIRPGGVSSSWSVRPRLMATYYLHLARLFWISKNYLFHAYATYRHHSLSSSSSSNSSSGGSGGASSSLESEQESHGRALLAALCIPEDPKSSPNHALGVDEDAGVSGGTVNGQYGKIATLLGFHTTNPSRSGLLTELVSRGTLEKVAPHLKELYLLLEKSSDPLVLVTKAKPLLDQLKAKAGGANAAGTTATTATTPGTDEEGGDEEEKKEEVEQGEESGGASTRTSDPLGPYVEQLTQVLLLKLLHMLAAAYHTVSLDHLEMLTSGLGLSFEQVEVVMVLQQQQQSSSSMGGSQSFGGHHNYQLPASLRAQPSLQIRIDHRRRCLRFGSSSALESEGLRGQLSGLSRRLAAALGRHEGAQLDETAARQRAAVFAAIRANVPVERERAAARKVEIEKRKEEVERLARERLRAELRLKADREEAARAEEQKRLRREKELRQREKEKKIQQDLEEMEKKKYWEAIYGRDVPDDVDVAELDTERLAQEHAASAAAAAQAAERKLVEASRRLDYRVRALRIESLPLVRKAFAESVEADRERYATDVVERAKRARAQWEKDTEERSVLESYGVYAGTLEAAQKLGMGRRRRRHAELCAEADRVALDAAEVERRERAIQRRADERRRRKEEAAARAAEEERARKEEEKRRKAEEDEKRRRQELARMAERKAARDGGGDAPPPEQPTKYVPPTQRGARSGLAAMTTGRRFDDRGGGYGGGRYDGSETDGRIGSAGGGRFADRGTDGPPSRFSDSRFGADMDRDRDVAPAPASAGAPGGGMGRFSDRERDHDRDRDGNSGNSGNGRFGDRAAEGSRFGAASRFGDRAADGDRGRDREGGRFSGGGAGSRFGDRDGPSRFGDRDRYDGGTDRAGGSRFGDRDADAPRFSDRFGDRDRNRPRFDRRDGGRPTAGGDREREPPRTNSRWS